IHMFIGLTLIDLLRDRYSAKILLPAITALMLAMAWCIHRFIERPVSRMLKNAMNKSVVELRRNTEPRKSRLSFLGGSGDAGGRTPYP
ncbi:acyltransferase family protein, partial [Streptomyces sp. URMC 126]